MSVKKPDLTVVIPTYNRGHVLIDTIHGVLTQDHTNIELLVIDQTPTLSKEFQALIKSINDRRFHYIKVGPPSLIAARNFALRCAKAEIVLFIDDDVIVTKRLVKSHLHTYSKYPDISAVAGRVMQKGFPVKNEILHFNELAVSKGVFTANRSGYTNAFPGGNCSMRVADALKIGGFDTRFYGNFFREESDMSIRMSKAGMKIFYEPTAELLHLATPRGGTRTKTYTDIRDTQMFYNNEIFFTIRAADKKFKALRYKYNEYCKRDGHLMRRRLVRFIIGLVAAYWRLLFGRQTIASEIPS